jgi:hypothetical protein
VKGIEPSYAAWEAAVLPLNYTRGEVMLTHQTTPRKPCAPPEYAESVESVDIEDNRTP